MNDLDKLVARCNEMDITEQINWLGDAIMPGNAAADLAHLRAQVATLEAERDALFQAVVLAVKAIEPAAFGKMTDEMSALDSYLANEIEDDLWERINTAATAAADDTAPAGRRG